MPASHDTPLALHVTLRWRDDVIAFRSLTGDTIAAVGAGPDAIAPIPCAVHATGHLAFAHVAKGGAYAIAAEGSATTIRRASGAYEIVEGPAQIPLAAGDAVDLRLGDFHVEAMAGASEPLPRERRRSAGAWAGIGIAALAHAVAFGLAVQDARASSAEDREEERAVDLHALMASAEQRARAADPPTPDGTGAGDARTQNAKAGDGRKGGGTKAEGEEGKMGDRLARAGAPKRFAVPEQMKKDLEPSVSRAEALADASTFGMIGMLAQGPHTPSAAFGDFESHGHDALAARGDLWARDVGESFGAGGLGLTGIGEGGGGRGEGIGLGSIGMLGHTDGTPGDGTGGDGSLGLMRGGGWSPRWGMHHRTRPPVIRTYRGVYRGTYCGYGCSVSGRLPPQAIQRIIRQNFGRFRACYEQGLVRNPALQGTVRTRFVIGRDGAVASAQNGGSDLPDAEVVSCVVRAFYGISFPQPEGGIVTVTYPIAFSNSI
ncbi:Hypothetical protein A7982_07333 [Minicystis rosea]|nr:Hypothetical protein A7982_07333 [Minicystis rosea]